MRRPTFCAEMPVPVIVCFVLIWLGLALVLTAAFWVGTLFLQGLFYTEPANRLHWRSPAAGAVVGLFLAFWCYLAYANPEEGTTAAGKVGPKYDTLFRFSPRQRTEYPEFWVVRGDDRPDHRQHFRLTLNDQGRAVYYDEHHKRPPEHADEIVVQENGQEVHFRAERETQGPDKGKLLIRRGQALRYLDDRGRVMSDDDLGHIYSVRWSKAFVSVGLNALHLVVWFAALWLLLRFQWTHALGLAVVIWGVLTLIVLPMMLDYAADRGVERAAQHAPTARLTRPPTGCA